MQANWALGILGLVLSVHLSDYAQGPRTQPSAPKSFASVEGHVICSDGGAPARQATVRLRLLSRLLAHQDQPKNPSDEKTDFNGYYRFPSVAPGIYLVSVKQDGYNDNYGVAFTILDHFDPDEQKKILATFPQVAVSSSGSFQQDVVIHRAASISGRVTMDSG